MDANADKNTENEGGSKISGSKGVFSPNSAVLRTIKKDMGLDRSFLNRFAKLARFMQNSPITNKPNLDTQACIIKEMRKVGVIK